LFGTLIHIEVKSWIRIRICGSGNAGQVEEEIKEGKQA
jgi:hypothetical protein